MLCSKLPGPGRITVPFAATLPIPTARHASQRPETRLPRTIADFRTWSRSAHRVFQQRLKYRLQFTRRRSDDFENLSGREQLLQGLVPLPDESRDLFFRAPRALQPVPLLWLLWTKLTLPLEGPLLRSMVPQAHTPNRLERSL